MVPFGPQGTVASKIFSINSTRRVQIDVVDLFCGGDRFLVKASRVGRDKIYELITSDVSADKCQVTTPDAEMAWNYDDLWSSGSMVLSPGSYTIKIIVMSSPYNGGIMAIRARYH